METLGILLLLMKSLRLRLGLLGLESFTDTTPLVGGKKLWIVGFFGLFILLLLDDISSFSSDKKVCWLAWLVCCCCCDHKRASH